MRRSTLFKLLLVVIISFMSLSACSKEEDPTEEKPIIGVDENEKGVSLSIPDSYPSELIPVYPNSHLYSVIESNQSFTIMFYSKDDVSIVIDFYKNIFRNAKNKMETVLADSFTSYGELEGYTYTIDVSDDSDMEGYKTLVILGVVMNQK